MNTGKEPSEPRLSLDQLGWRASFEQAMAPFRQEGLVPARVIAEHRGVYRVATPQGEMPAEVTGRLMHHAGDRLDYPVVGDWVAAAAPDQGGLAVVHAVLPRTSVLARKSSGRKYEGQAIAANVDIIFVVIGLDHNFNLNRMERYESFLKLGREQEHLEAKTDWFKQQKKRAYGRSIAKAVKELYKRKGR